MDHQRGSCESTPPDATLADLVKYYVREGPDETLSAFGRERIMKIFERGAEEVKTERTPWSPDYTDLHRCNDVGDVRAVIERARREGKVVRVVGSHHSAPRAVFAQSDQPSIPIKLEKELRELTVLEENKEEGYVVIRVGAGCNLGIDPSDNESTAENSFNRIVDRMGYALPILGGMSHQTFGGFMMTSTAGGSLQYGLSDVMESFELLDGLGRSHVLNKGTDDFYAAGVSMGLFGVITHVTVKLRKSYLVKGVEETVATKDSILADAATLEAALREQAYVHCLWFPDAGVDRVLQYKADQAPCTEPIVPYEHELQQKWRNYAAAAALYAVNELESTGLDVLQSVARFIVTLMNPIDEPKRFCDRWHLALPHDDQALIDTLLRVQFTEVWLDVSKTGEVLSALRDLFKSDERADGNFGIEIYGAKESPFWMSQSYGRDVVRIDPYWWEYNPRGSLEEFFTKYWDVLLTIPTARLHWGKHFPEVGARFGDMTMGPDYVTRAFPRFGDWLKLRAKYDPEQVFVTTYWRRLLGIPQL
ncbi:D-arabinono-1,4-lactone oxidase [Sorangium sp. So ce216]